MFFSTSIARTEDSYELNLHCMRFEEDFVHMLRKFGRLPFASNEESLAIANCIEEQKIALDKFKE